MNDALTPLVHLDGSAPAQSLKVSDQPILYALRYSNFAQILKIFVYNRNEVRAIESLTKALASPPSSLFCG